MTFFKYAANDNGYGNLLSGISASQLSIQSQASQGSRFSSANFIMTIVQYTVTGDATTPIVKYEKVLVSIRSGDTFTITRGYDGTTATTFNSGDNIYQNVVAAIITDIQNELDRLETAKLNISDFQAGNKTYGASATGTDAYAITTSPVITAYTVGQTFRILADVANTGPATLNVCSLGAKTIKKQHDNDLLTGDIEAGKIFTVTYDGTNFQMDSQLDSIPTLDISGQTEDTGGDMNADFLIEYDTSAGANRKILPSRWRATDAEADAGTATNKFVTPAQLVEYAGAIYSGTDFTASTGTNSGSSSSTTYVKLFQGTVKRSGTYLVDYIVTSPSGTGNNAYGRIYKNGVAFGTETGAFGSGGGPAIVGSSESLTFSANDKIEMWVKCVGWGGSFLSSISGFQIRYDYGAKTKINMA